jgi:2'-5' RNA ligase
LKEETLAYWGDVTPKPNKELQQDLRKIKQKTDVQFIQSI